MSKKDLIINVFYFNVSNDFFNSDTFPKYKDKWIDGRGYDIDIVIASIIKIFFSIDE